MKTREFLDKNYRAVFINGRTLRIAIDPKKPILKLDYPEILDVSFGDKCESGRCPFCFLEGSLVQTVTGEKPIEAIEKGEEVYCFDEESKLQTTSEVSQLHKRHYSGEIISIELENGKTIHCTPNHKLFTKNNGWIEAKDLTKDDDLLEIV